MGNVDPAYVLAVQLGLAHWMYEKLLITEPTIRSAGLWRSGVRYYIVCPDLEADPMTSAGIGLKKWFRDNKPMLVDIQPAAEAPENATEVEPRTAEDRATLQGEPRTIRNLFVDLVTVLQKSFPDFCIGPEPHEVVIVAARKLTPFEFDDLQDALRLLGYPVTPRIRVNPEEVNAHRSFRLPTGGKADLDLFPSKCIANASSILRRALEEDEDFWAQTRVKLLAGSLLALEDVLPPSFRSRKARCVVNSAAFPPHNIRAMLALYDQVVLVVPPPSNYRRVLEQLSVEEDSLVDLAVRGRVSFLVPQALDNCPIPLVTKVLEAAPTSVLLSHRLATATVVDSRRRMPLLYPPIDARTRHALLAIMEEAVSRIPDAGGSALLRTTLSELGRIWLDFESLLNYRGAMATSMLGMGAIAGRVLEEQSAPGAALRFWLAAAPVEWGAALGATVFPAALSGDSEQAITEVCASLCSGVPDRPVPVNEVGQVEAILEGIRVLESDAPVVEVATAFGGKDSARLRKIIQGLSDEGFRPDYLHAAIEDFNRKVDEFDSRRSRVRRLDLVTLAGAITMAVAGEEAELVRFIPLTVWLLKYLLQVQPAMVSIPTGLVDLAWSAATWTPSEVVLVARLRTTT